MYVFVTVAELTGKERQFSLPEVENGAAIQKLLEDCLKRSDQYLLADSRDVSRHFWYGDEFVPLTGYVSDLKAPGNVTLELRPDTYKVRLPRESVATFAINPEWPIADAIDLLMNAKGAWRCYQMLPRDGKPLAEDTSLYAENALPYHARLSQKEIELVVRRKPQVFLWIALLVIGFVAAGLLLGYLFASLS